MSIVIMFLISAAIAVAVFVAGYVALLLVWAKCWIDREKMPNLGDIGVVKWVDSWTLIEIPRGRGYWDSDYAIGLIIAACYTFSGLSLIIIFTHLLILSIIILAAAAIVGSMYALRWRGDIRKALAKCKEKRDAEEFKKAERLES